MFIGNICHILKPCYIEAENGYTNTKTWIAAHRGFIELAASFAFNLSLIRYFAKPLLFFDAARHVLFGTAVQVSWVAYRHFHPDSKIPEPGQHIARTSAAIFAGRAGLQTAIHESGHALMALCCFLKANPEISIFPFKGGSTSYAVSYGTTSFGALLGKEGALVLIAASGMMATTASALLALGAADQLEKKYPRVAKCLTYQSAAHILIELDYGRQVFLTSKNDVAHDFMYMWEYGKIHPLIPMFLIAALPLSLYALLQRRKPIWPRSRLEN